MKRLLTIPLLTLLLAGCGIPAAGDDSITVNYYVSDNAGGTLSLTYTNAGGNTEQQQITVGPLETWTKEFTMERGDHVYLSVQRGDGGGKVFCTINGNNKRIERAESSGPFTIATCSGRARD